MNKLLDGIAVLICGLIGLAGLTVFFGVVLAVWQFFLILISLVTIFTVSLWAICRLEGIERRNRK